MKSVSVWIAFILCYSLTSAQSRDKWWHLRSHFSSTCCECVPFYGCEDKIVNEEKLGNFDRSKSITNVQDCPNLQEYCCPVPDKSEECKSFKIGNMPPPIDKMPRPDVKCECIPWETCSLENIVTDGKGITSKSFEEKGLVSHSQCPDEIDVCCEVKSKIKTRKSLADDPQIMTPMESILKDACVCINKDKCSQKNPDGVGIVDPRITFDEDHKDEDIHRHCKEDEVCCPLNSPQGASHGDKIQLKFYLYILVPFLCYVTP